MNAWWDDLPDGSVVLYAGMPLDRDNGEWYFGEFLRKETFHTPPLVIHVPVTDQEPPVGSVVECDDNMIWWRSDDWECLTVVEGSWYEDWQELRPTVTRILRWGE